MFGTRAAVSMVFGVVWALMSPGHAQDRNGDRAPAYQAAFDCIDAFAARVERLLGDDGGILLPGSAVKSACATTLARATFYRANVIAAELYNARRPQNERAAAIDSVTGAIENVPHGAFDDLGFGYGVKPPAHPEIAPYELNTPIEIEEYLARALLDAREARLNAAKSAD